MSPYGEIGGRVETILRTRAKPLCHGVESEDQVTCIRASARPAHLRYFNNHFAPVLFSVSLSFVLYTTLYIVL